MENKVELTVALPVFDSGSIVWLALESLCRQNKPDFNWELIVAEERIDNYLGLDKLNRYKKRLSKIGCKKIVYIDVEEWMFLSQKWRMIESASSLTSEVFVLQAADCYSEPNRLIDTYKKIVLDGYDWISNIYGVYYDLKACKEILYDHTTLPKEVMTGLNMACKMILMRKLPDKNIYRGVDGWIYRLLEEVKGKKLKVFWNKDKTWKKGLDTHGLNKISKERNKYWDDELKAPFRKTNIKIKDILPKSIYNKLIKLKIDNKSIDIDELVKERFGATTKHKFFTKYYSKPISQVQRKVQCFGSG